MNAKQTSNGFEGIAEADGKLVVAFQLPWTGDMANHARIGVYDLTTQTWSFMFYPLDLPHLGQRRLGRLVGNHGAGQQPLRRDRA